jgi:hypothetical protein
LHGNFPLGNGLFLRLIGNKILIDRNPCDEDGCRQPSKGDPRSPLPGGRRLLLLRSGSFGGSPRFPLRLEDSSLIR